MLISRTEMRLAKEPSETRFKSTTQRNDETARSRPTNPEIPTGIEGPAIGGWEDATERNRCCLKCHTALPIERDFFLTGRFLRKNKNKKQSSMHKPQSLTYEVAEFNYAPKPYR
ncbi:hypothetical protein U1Q18_014777 [Sarracenia purpurea var. burkii]